MNPIDLGILIILVFFALKGLFRGLFIEVMTLVGLILAYMIALREMGSVALWLGKALSLSPLISSILAFTVVYVVVFVICRIIAGFLKRIFRKTPVAWLDRVGGLLFGVFKGVLIASLLALLISLIPLSEALAKKRDASLLFHPVRTVAPWLFNYLKETLPDTKNFYEEVKESFSKKSQEISDIMLKDRLENLQRSLAGKVEDQLQEQKNEHEQ